MGVRVWGCGCGCRCRIGWRREGGGDVGKGVSV